MWVKISMSFASHMLRRLTTKKHLTRIYQGLWADTQNIHFNAFVVVPYLTRPHLAAVSLLSALHLHEMIEQIPQTIYVVTTAHTKRIKTPVGSYSLHHMTPEFFDGYDYYQKEGSFLIACPEKALIDCLYLSSRKGRGFFTLPELTLPKNFNYHLCLKFIKKIHYPRLQVTVQKKLETFSKRGLE